MNIDEVYMGLATNIIDGIHDSWEKAVLDIEKPALDVVSFSGSYHNDNGENSFKFKNFDRKKLKQDANMLYEITTENNSNKWNRAKFTLKPSGDFSIDFQWDQALDDEIKANQ